MTREERYTMLDTSYKASISDTKFRTIKDEEAVEFRRLFDKMAPKLSDIGFDNCFVDACARRGWLEFNLFCPGELRLSACMTLSQTNEDVMVDVSRKKHKITIGVMPSLDKLVNAANQAILIAQEPETSDDNGNPD